MAYLPTDMGGLTVEDLDNIDAAVRDYDRLVSEGVHALEAAIRIRAQYEIPLNQLAKFVLDR